MIYISISTIPSRVNFLNKTIESILKQTKKPDKIFVNIPYEYKRFKEKILDENMPKFDSTVELTRCEDYGPGTKLLGSINKFNQDSLLILVDDDHIYENFMIEKFYEFYKKDSNNAYSFYVHPIGKFGVGQGADGFAINTNHLKNIDKFFDLIVKNNEELFLHDDLWISFFLKFIKQIKILSLHNFLEKDKNGKRQTIYKKHIDKDSLHLSYGNNIIEAIKERDRRSISCLNFMAEKSKFFKH